MAKPPQIRPFAMALILVRLPMAMKCLVAVAPRTGQVLSMDCYRCPFGNDAVLSTQQQQKMTPRRGDTAGVNLGWTQGLGGNVRQSYAF
jgi:hypothetical protein